MPQTPEEIALAYARELENCKTNAPSPEDLAEMEAWSKEVMVLGHIFEGNGKYLHIPESDSAFLARYTASMFVGIGNFSQAEWETAVKNGFFDDDDVEGE